MATELKQRVKQREQLQQQEGERDVKTSSSIPPAAGTMAPRKRVRTTAQHNKDTGFDHWPNFAKFVAVFLFAYYCFMMATRGYYAFVDTLWVCNLNLLLACVGIFTGYRPLIGATINAVFLPHILWVIDALTYKFTGSFPLGLAAYIAWPDTAVAELITSTHHVWFVPLLMLVLHKNGGIPFWGWPISIGMISPVLFVSWFFPEEIILENGEPYYLNVNLAHGWWRDMTGWPWDLIPKKSPDYMIFLNLFIACQFTVSFLLAVLGGWIFIKRR